MAKLYPKAAKKRRVRNKWRNRFGADVNMKELVTERNPFLETLLNEPFGEGKFYPVPIIKGDEE